MKNTFLSQQEFFSKYPSGNNLADFVKTLVPAQALPEFKKARKAEENTYEATYDIFSADRNKLGQITVSCTEAPGVDPEYKVISKSGLL